MTACAGVAAAVVAHLSAPIAAFFKDCVARALGACLLVHQGLLERVRKMSFYTMLDPAHASGAVVEAEGGRDSESLGPALKAWDGRDEGEGGMSQEDAGRERRGRGSKGEAKREVLRVLEQNRLDPQELLLPKGTGDTAQSTSQ